MMKQMEQAEQLEQVKQRTDLTPQYTDEGALILTCEIVHSVGSGSYGMFYEYKADFKRICGKAVGVKLYDNADDAILSHWRQKTLSMDGFAPPVYSDVQTYESRGETYWGYDTGVAENVGFASWDQCRDLRDQLSSECDLCWADYKPNNCGEYDGRLVIVDMDCHTKDWGDKWNMEGLDDERHY